MRGRTPAGGRRHVVGFHRRDDVRGHDQGAEARRPPELYVRFCGNCHGADALGGRSDESVAREESDEVEEIVRKGHGGNDYGDRKEYMPKWPASELSDAEVAAIAAWLAALPGGGDDA